MPSYPRRLRYAAIAAAVATSSVLAFAGATVSSSTAAQAPTACVNATIENGSFENPVIPANSFRQPNESTVPGWETSATDGLIEIWRAPFNGVPVPAGSQFAEINATQIASLYQDFATTPGETIRWEMQHRGRTGVDVMEVRLGAPNGALTVQTTIANGQTWRTYSGLYTVPAGQTMTRLSFTSISSANGSPSFGNFVEAVSVTSGACVVTTKSVVPLSGSDIVRLGDTLQYSIVATNQGASAASLSSVIDTLPVGVSLVPGTIEVTQGASTVPATDAAGDDLGEYDAASREVRARVGAGASSAVGGTLAAGASVTVTFDVIVDSVTALPSVDNTATVAFTDTLSTQSRVSTSNTTTTTITPDAPAVSIVTSGTVTPTENQAAANEGDSIAWSYVVTNTGNVPLTDVTVNDPEGGTITCVPTTLAVGLNATCTGTATHTVTLADLGVGSVSNGATASALPPFGAASIESTESVATITTVAVAPAVSIVTSGTVTPTENQTAANEGDSIAWSYVVTNTGNVPLTDVTVNDPEGGTITCVPTTLAVGLNATCTGTATHTVTLADLGVGSVSNGATASALPPFGAASIESTESVATITTAAPVPAIEVTVWHENTTSPEPGAEIVAGDQLRAHFVVTNTGNSTLTDVLVNDPMFGTVTCLATTLDPGDSTTCVADNLYTVTDDDALAGSMWRTITATGDAALGVASTSVSDEQTVGLDVALDLPTLPLPEPEPELPTLAFTGTELDRPLTVAFGLLLAGLLALGTSRLVVIGRRRQGSTAR